MKSEVGCGVLMVLLYVALAACTGNQGVEQSDFRAQSISAQQLTDECRQKLGVLREDVLRETCKLIENHIAVIEAKMQVLCKDAGEVIYRTADNVDGIYVHILEKNPDKVFRYYHEDDRLPSSYMSPTLGKHYTFWEMDSFRKGGMIEQHTLEVSLQGNGKAKWSETHKQIASPKAAYGIRWKYLTSVEEQRQGLFGEELIVFDVETQQTMGVRRGFFYVVDNGINDASGQTTIHMRVPMRGPYRFETCQNYNLGSDEAYVDQRPRHSYHFVSKVLHPRTMPNEIAVHVFDLARGVGNRSLNAHMSGCHTFGPRITPDDLQLTKVNQWDLQIAIKGTGDSLTCTSFFHPTRFGNEQADAFVTFRFYDGTKWKAEDIVKQIDR